MKSGGSETISVPFGMLEVATIPRPFLGTFLSEKSGNAIFMRGTSTGAP